MTKLSININKVALIRNSRGGNYPDLVQFAQDCEAFGAQGITIHPRPDERHARFADIGDLKAVVKTELNIEGKPHARFIDEVLRHRPHQCTLVPDADNALTSDSGWDTIKYESLLTDVIKDLKAAGIRTSIFLNAEPRLMASAARTGCDRIEFYTGPYADNFSKNPVAAIADFVAAAEAAQAVGLGLNAGHDLNLKNLRYFRQQIPHLLEVSIGHALISDALYYGLNNTVQQYLHQLT